MVANWRVIAMAPDGSSTEIEHVTKWELAQGWIEFTLTDRSLLVIPNSLGLQFSINYVGMDKPLSDQTVTAPSIDVAKQEMDGFKSGYKDYMDATLLAQIRDLQEAPTPDEPDYEPSIDVAKQAAFKSGYRTTDTGSWPDRNATLHKHSCGWICGKWYGCTHKDDVCPITGLAHGALLMPPGDKGSVA